MSEVWKDIPGYEGYYSISNRGRVKSHHKRSNGQIKVPSYHQKMPYARIQLSKKGKISTHQVHRLVALTFITNPLNKAEVNHIDSNPLNNDVSNLEWATKHENMRHAYRYGNKRQDGEFNANSRLTKEDVVDIRKFHQLGMTVAEIHNGYRIVSYQCIHRIVNNTLWKGIGI